MKLYATTTSERASKGQGGEYLDIVIYNEDKQPAIALKVTANITGGVRATVYRDMRYGQTIINDSTGFIENADKYKEKGNQQKDEHDCGGCGATQMTKTGKCDSCTGRSQE